MADEVKVFRTNDADEANDLASSSAELIADKKDLAMEADIESQSEPLAQRMITPLQSAFMNVPSPSYDFLFPLFMPSPLSPLQSYAAAAATLSYHNAAAAAAANNPLLKMSPVAAALSTAHFAAALARHSPNYMNMGQFGAGGGGFHNGNFFPSGAHHMHNLQQSTSAAGLNSPLTNMANGLNGISLGSQHKLQQQHRRMQNGDQTPHHTPTTPKTPKREKPPRSGASSDKKDKGHIKKPCNAFMWFMKVNRQKLLEKEECQQKQSAMLNQQLGKMWQEMPKAAQQEYYDMAAAEREAHQQQYPNWTARENYAIHKKKKKKREKSLENNDQKKCRARFGVDNQAQWCKHCRRKKRCLNVRDSDSPMAGMVTSTTSVTPSSSHSQQSNYQSAFMSQSAQPSAFKQFLDSPSSSGMSASVGKRSESTSSADTQAGRHTPPTPNSNRSMQQVKMELPQPIPSQQPMPTFPTPTGLHLPNMFSNYSGNGLLNLSSTPNGNVGNLPAFPASSPHSFFKR